MLTLAAVIFLWHMDLFGELVLVFITSSQVSCFIVKSFNTWSISVWANIKQLFKLFPTSAPSGGSMKKDIVADSNARRYPPHRSNHGTQSEQSESSICSSIHSPQPHPFTDFAALVTLLCPLLPPARDLSHFSVNISFWGSWWNNWCCRSSWEDRLCLAVVNAFIRFLFMTKVFHCQHLFFAKPLNRQRMVCLFILHEIPLEYIMTSYWTATACIWGNKAARSQHKEEALPPRLQSLWSSWGQTCALYSAHQRLKPATAGGWSVGVGVCVRPSRKVSRVFRYPNFLCPVSPGLKKLF